MRTVATRDRLAGRSARAVHGCGCRPDVQFADIDEGGRHRRSRTRTPPPRTSTWSRRWAAAWRCSTTTTTAASTCSSPTAPRSTTRCRPARRPDKSDPMYWNRLYRQSPDGTFTDVTEKAGLTRHAAEPLRHGRRRRRLRQRRLRRPLRHRLRRQHALSQQRRRHLRRRDDSGPASRPAGGARAPDSSTTTTTADLDLFVTRYLAWSFQNNRHCGEKKPGYRAYCHPDNFDGVANLLFRNNGDGTFTDVSAKAGIADASGKGLGVAFADYDDDGFIDVYVANDSVQSFLYRNKADGTFAEVGLLAGVGIQRGRQDVRRHGRRLRRLRQRRPPRRHRHRSVERALSTLSPERRRQLPRRHQHLRRRRRDAAVLGLEHAVRRLRQRRLEGHLRRAGTRDGHDREDRRPTCDTCSRRCCCATSRDGSCGCIAGAAFEQDWAGRGAAFGDLDNDGDLDVVLSNVGQPAVVLRNDGGNRRGWLRIVTPSARDRTVTASAAASRWCRRPG